MTYSTTDFAGKNMSLSLNLATKLRVPGAKDSHFDHRPVNMGAHGRTAAILQPCKLIEARRFAEKESTYREGPSWADAN